jgi:Fe-S cluster assembly iron-binding protein IscA
MQNLCRLVKKKMSSTPLRLTVILSGVEGYFYILDFNPRVQLNDIKSSISIIYRLSQK